MPNSHHVLSSSSVPITLLSTDYSETAGIICVLKELLVQWGERHTPRHLENSVARQGHEVKVLCHHPRATWGALRLLGEGTGFPGPCTPQLHDPVVQQFLPLLFFTLFPLGIGPSCHSKLCVFLQGFSFLPILIHKLSFLSTRTTLFIY